MDPHRSPGARVVAEEVLELAADREEVGVLRPGAATVADQGEGPMAHLLADAVGTRRDGELGQPLQLGQQADRGGPAAAAFHSDSAVSRQVWTYPRLHQLGAGQEDVAGSPKRGLATADSTSGRPQDEGLSGM